MPGRLELRECAQCGTGFGTRRGEQRFCSRGCARAAQPGRNRGPGVPVGDLGWMVRAACRGHDPRLWFASDRSPEARRARTICFGCPVQGECFQWAMAVEGTEALNYRDGIYGGFGPRFRADLARKRAAAKTGAGVP